MEFPLCVAGAVETNGNKLHPPLPVRLGRSGDKLPPAAANDAAVAASGTFYRRN